MDAFLFFAAPTPEGLRHFLELLGSVEGQLAGLTAPLGPYAWQFEASTPRRHVEEVEHWYAVNLAVAMAIAPEVHSIAASTAEASQLHAQLAAGVEHTIGILENEMPQEMQRWQIRRKLGEPRWRPQDNPPKLLSELLRSLEWLLCDLIDESKGLPAERGAFALAHAEAFLIWQASLTGCWSLLPKGRADQFYQAPELHIPLRSYLWPEQVNDLVRFRDAAASHVFAYESLLEQFEALNEATRQQTPEGAPLIMRTPPPAEGWEEEQALFRALLPTLIDQLPPMLREGRTWLGWHEWLGYE